MGALPPHHRAARDRLQPFLAALARESFAGDVAADEASLTVYSTDNSIYQLEPSAVVFPRDGADIARLVRAAKATGMPVTARGGGTGTNGQSLTGGVIADVSRHMNRVLDFDAAAMRVTVEPGVVLDQLNAFLKPHGLFFPPTVSTASRATIGGMVATDASGKGSRIYGRTSDYVEALDVVLPDGSEEVIRSLSKAEAFDLAKGRNRLAHTARIAMEGVADKADLIAAVFPKMNRGLTGYNLEQMTSTDGSLHLQKLLSGSEGTLAFTRAITLRLISRPAHRAIAVLRYASFDAALSDIQRLLSADPAAIEIMDDKVLSLAQEDVVWTTLEAVLGGPTEVPVMGLNVAEFVGDTVEAVEAQLARLSALAVPTDAGVLDQLIVRDAALVSTVWDLRKKAVGLLGRLGGVPFIEDTAVPPQHLDAYVREFRALLDDHGLDYGMFGHADVGCLHVRPVLDLRRPEHAALIRPLSDAVAALTKRYGGLIWGEHGRGFRGEYSPSFFGPELYDLLCEIKAAFDPKNLFNPGKLAPAFKGAAVDKIDGIPFRGELDRQIEGETFGKAVSCNGNGACHGWDSFDLMCPSYKATRDRNQSPKGRAALLREWARRRSTGENRLPKFAAFENEVKAALDTCLSCKACSSLCPVKVDIPATKAEFTDTYFETRTRQLRDRLLPMLEPMLGMARRVPGLANAVMQFPPVRSMVEHVLGLVDLPHVHPAPPPRAVRGEGGAVLLLEDGFTSTFDGRLVGAVERLLTALGYRVTRLAPEANGKALHVRGLLKPFRSIAQKAMRRAEKAAANGHPIIALDAATALMYADEYPKTTGLALSSPVTLLEDFLLQEIKAGRIAPAREVLGLHYTLLSHCTEKSARPASSRQWAEIFGAFGLKLETPATGCCGMAGLFGHEKEHKALSKTLFEMSWKPILDRREPETVLASGFSCRCQTERFEGFRPRHPAEALLHHLTAEDHRTNPC